MTEREVLKLALEALQKIYIAPEHEEYIRVWWPACEQAIPAIKEALAQPEQEPVACVTYKEVADTMNGLWGGTLVQRQIAEELENTMLYTTPPHRTWVGLRDDEIKNACDKHTNWFAIAFDLEAKLKEKNT